jgi:phenylacetate-CoA ligase
MKLERMMDIAFRSPEEMEEVQRERLLAHIDYCRSQSPYYRDVLKGIDIRSGGTLAEILSALPLTEKADLEARNDDFCAVPPGRIVDIVMSSGTTGKPTKIAYSEYDLQRLAYNEEKSFLACGLTPDDIVLLTCTIDRCFVAGLAYFLGVRSIGAAAVRNGHGSMQSHAEIIKRLDPTVIVGVPTFVRKLGLFMRESGQDPTKTAVSRIVCIGEPLRGRDLTAVRVGQDLESIWDARAYSTYASSETVTTFCECTSRCGGHLHPDLAVVEIVDPEGNCLPAGEPGEAVVTPLAVEGMPLVRFRTGDISFLIDEPCSCGRRSPRLGPILGRRKQMLKIKGTTVYPPAVFDALSEIDFVTDYYLSVSSEDDLSDRLTVHVTVKEGMGDERTVQEGLQARIRVKPEVVIEEDAELRRNVYLPELRKPRRFIDQRKS